MIADKDLRIYEVRQQNRKENVVVFGN